MSKIAEFQQILETSIRELGNEDAIQAATDAALVILEASELAQLVGAGHLAAHPRDYGSYNGEPVYSVHEAKSVLGRMLAWCREQQKSQLLTVKEVAGLLNVSEKSIYAACEAGKLSHHRIGKGRGTIRIARESIPELVCQPTPQQVTPRDYLAE